MPDRENLSDAFPSELNYPLLKPAENNQHSTTDQYLPLTITKAASKQTYYTIRFLADRERILDAYRAYAYFRWVDDMLDEKLTASAERKNFLKRQQIIINSSFANEYLYSLNPEEHILSDLIRNNHQHGTGLELYIRNMMAVMAFDAERKGHLISQRQLTQYSKHLSTAVTEALHYFIGHDSPAPQTPTRYLAVTGAHITHMLRDSVEDVSAGYFNIPCEFLDAHHFDPCDIKNPAYKIWTKSRAQLARTYLSAGKSYVSQIANLRCRFAGFAYIARFEEVLKLIEKDNYQLRADYSDRKSLKAGLSMSTFVLSYMLKSFIWSQI